MFQRPNLRTVQQSTKAFQIQQGLPPQPLLMPAAPGRVTGETECLAEYEAAEGKSWRTVRDRFGDKWKDVAFPEPLIFCGGRFHIM